MVNLENIVEELQTIVGAENAFAPKEHKFVVGGLTPSAIVLPATYEEVAAVMRVANERTLAVIPGVPSFLMIVGNIPRRYDVALSLERLNEIIEYEPADLTVTCQAGITVDDLQCRLGENGQMVPFGLSSPAPHAIGALVAANFSMLRLAHGTPRDFTIGMRVVTADGRITRAGGKVVKNVAGYDLCKLYAGSRGTLGVIVEATFRLVPLPQTTDRVELAFVRLQEACKFALDTYRRGLSLSAVDVRRDIREDRDTGASASAWVLRIDLSGTVAGVKRTRREIEHTAQAFGSREYEPPRVSEEASKESFYAWQGNRLECEASVLPTQVAGLIEAFDRDTPGAWVQSVSPIEGIIRAAWRDAGTNEELVRRLRNLTAHIGGSLVVTTCSTELKRRIDVFGDPPPAFDLMRRVKQEFDPKGILSPGRFVGRL